jgi:hypothetical protein
MGRLRALVFLPLLIFVSVTGNAQGQTTLQLGTPIDRKLGPGEVQEFTIKLEENALMQIVVEQRGIDVIVKVFSPAGKSIGEYDTPNGSDGPEHVSLVAVTPGTYRVAVTPLDPANPSSGHFQIKLVELRQATEQEIKASKNQEVVKAKGIALLFELEGLIAQIKSPFMRIKAQLEAAQLLWSSDEKRAAKYFADATNGFKEYLTSVDVNSEQYPQQYAQMSQLRFEMIQVLAARDPDAALNFLYSTVPPANPNGNPQENLEQESMLELTIANQIMLTDPNRTMKIARRNLKKSYSTNLLSVVSSLRQKNPELASELANEIASKLLTEKLLSKADAASLAIGLIRFGQVPVRRGQAVNLNGNAARVALLPDGQYRELLQKALTEALSFSQPPSRSYTPERDAAWNLLSGLQQFGSELDLLMTGGAAAVEKKLAELSSQQFATVQVQTEASNASLDATLEFIEKAPAEQKEQLYIQLAGREANNGDIVRARQIINERVSNPYQRRNSLINLEQQEIYRAMSKGKIEEALRIISGFRTAKERASFLSQIASQIGPGQKRANVINFLEQARSLLGPSVQAQEQEQMNALIEIARAFARYDSKRSFEILEPLIDQFNELCAAARTMEGFGAESYEDEELNMQSGSSVAQIAQRMSSALGTLALVNFERAKSTSDTLRLPEVRLRAYLEMAQQTVQSK